MTKGSTCEKYFEHHWDKNFEPVCTCRLGSPNPCHAPLCVSAGVDIDVFVLSMHIAMGRMLSMHLVTQVPASPGVEFLVWKSFNLLLHTLPCNSFALRRCSCCCRTFSSFGGTVPSLCSSGSCPSSSGYSSSTNLRILAFKSRALPLPRKAS